MLAYGVLSTYTKRWVAQALFADRFFEFLKRNLVTVMRCFNRHSAWPEKKCCNNSCLTVKYDRNDEVVESVSCGLS